MSPSEARAQIKARIWQAIAENKLDVSALPRPTLDVLVDVAADAALLELDEEMGRVAGGRPEATADLGEETVLWEGRPFLSISTFYTITSERIRITEGLLAKERTDIELIRVQDIDHSQTLGERIMNLGDVTVRSHDRSQPQIVLRNVSDPQVVHEILRRAMLKSREKHGFTFREEM